MEMEKCFGVIFGRGSYGRAVRLYPCSSRRKRLHNHHSGLRGKGGGAALSAREGRRYQPTRCGSYTRTRRSG